MITARVWRNSKLRVWWIHFKIKWLGDKTFEKNGCLILPCKKCGVWFISYMHLGNNWYTYDDLCKICRVVAKW
jgi:hypothetical protein